MTSAYERGHAAGYAEAIERETLDAATAADGHIWFAVPAGAAPTAAEADDYERGFLAGWAEYFAGRS